MEPILEAILNLLRRQEGTLADILHTLKRLSLTPAETTPQRPSDLQLGAVRVLNTPLETTLTNTPLPTTLTNTPLEVLITNPQPTPKYAPISTTGNSTTTIVPAVAGKRIRVLSIVLAAETAGTIQWRSSPSSTNLSGVIALAANGIYSAACESGLIETESGESLVLVHTMSVGGHLSYLEV